MVVGEASIETDQADLLPKNWYGAYDFAEGRCFILYEGTCNKEHTIQFLQRLAAWLDDAPGAVVIIWEAPPGIGPTAYRLPQPNWTSRSSLCLPTVPT